MPKKSKSRTRKGTKTKSRLRGVHTYRNMGATHEERVRNAAAFWAGKKEGESECYRRHLRLALNHVRKHLKSRVSHGPISDDKFRRIAAKYKRGMKAGEDEEKLMHAAIRSALKA